MEKKLRYFLEVAEKLNISQTAKELYISQQGLSVQMRRLEKEYQARLFSRTHNRLALTPAGEALRKTLQHIKLLEGTLKTELQEIAQDNRGIINIGITSSRSNVILPDVIAKYGKEFPDISIHIMDGVTSLFEEKLLDEKLDCFIGVAPDNRPEFHIVPLFTERFYLTISAKMLRHYFGSEYLECIAVFKRGVDLARFHNIPIITPARNSRLYAPLQLYLNRNNYILNSYLTSNNDLLRYQMALANRAACISTRNTIALIRLLTPPSDPESKLYTFPINTTGIKDPVCLVSNRLVVHSSYVSSFFKALISGYASFTT